VINSKSVLTIIPARGGSKRLSRKNVLPLSGKPIISWTINAALKSKYIDNIVVSSDDDEIIDISLNASVIAIKRPQELSADDTPTISVVKHILSEIENNYSHVLLLQPTSPLRDHHDIDQSFELLIKKAGDAIISVCEVDHSPLLSNTLPPDGSLNQFIPNEVKNKRTQDLPKYYRINGAIYICKTDRLIKENTFFLKDNIYSYVMDKRKSVDIDDIFDYEFAQFLINSQYLIR